jgi:cardiolipin synthase A/B
MTGGGLATRASATFVESSWYESLAPVFTDGNEVTLLRGGIEFFPALEAALDEAKTEVFLETYIFENDASGKRIAHALARASGRGVIVQMMTDGFGTRILAPELAAILTAAGVKHQVFRPETRGFALDRQRLRRMHRKIVMIDGQTSFVGGINVLDDFFDPNHGALDQPRYDFAVRVRGPLVAYAHRAVSRMWWQNLIARRQVKRMEMPSTVRSDVTAIGTVRAKLVLRDNFRFRRTIEQEYLSAIKLAKKEILIANAYFFPGAKFQSELEQAARRGVRVRLLLQGRVEYRLQHYASLALYDQLLAAGIEIVEYKKSFLHAKVAVADDWATVGSSNIDPFSLLLARESNVVVSDVGFAALLRQEVILGMADGGVAVLRAEHSRRSLLTRLMHRASFVLLRIAVALTGAAAKY